MPDGAPGVDAVVPAAPADIATARALAARLSLPYSEVDAPAPGALLLVVEGAGRSLRLTGAGAPGPVAVEFGGGAMRHRRRGGANELLGRAVGVTARRQPRVLDATAGLGRDAFVLADLGAQVALAERQPVVAELLRAGLASAAAARDEWLGAVVGRMTLFEGDARELPLPPCDVIYLDPMFPGRDKSAAVRKEMALFQRLLARQEDDGAELLEWALCQPVSRVVVKRPLRAAELGGRSASHCIRGKAVRYDVHVLKKLPEVPP